MLAEEDDPILLEGVPQALVEWFSSKLRPDGLTTVAEAGLILHPKLREAIEILARRWSQAGISRQKAGQWGEAYVQFTVGGAAFALAGLRDEAIRALLYSTDALSRQGDTEHAALVLEFLAQDAGPVLSGEVLTRRLRTLAQVVVDGAFDPSNALDQAAPIMQRIERLGDASLIGAASLTFANLHYWANSYDTAVELARRAENLLTDESQKAVARTTIAQFTARQA